MRAALRDDTELSEMLNTPLMLSIVVLAYDGKSTAAAQSTGTPEQRRRHLFDAYIAAMFQRREAETHFSRQQTAHWLSWLSGQMVHHELTEYYIERMQPDWLAQQQRRRYKRAIRLFFGLGGALGGALLGGSVFGLGGALGGALLGGLRSGLRGEFEYSQITETHNWSWSRRALFGVLFGIVFGGLVFGQAGGLVYGLGGALVFGLMSGLAFGLVGGELTVKVTPNQGIRRSAWSWLIIGLRGGLVLGLVVGLIFGVDYGGSAVIQHYTLRWLLYRDGSLPLRLVPFLDYCAERIFLRKVGGGYIFVHRLLMEHFAAMNSEQGAVVPVETQQV